MRLFLLQLVIFLLFTPNGNAKCISNTKLDLDPIITTQPLSQLECEGNSVRFKVIASGSGLTYSWQRKKPTDADFVTITDELNTIEGTSTNEIKVSNVGSAKFPNGTQFQVVVSDVSSSVTSNIATLTVNEITNVSGATNVTQCFGTNYSYSVTTSYPANVVSYRWKKSVESGVWNEISDGGVYSGATTATLNITGGTPAESGEYRVYITFTSSGADCNVTSTSRNRKITFLPLLTSPETTIIQPGCIVSTGTISVKVQSITDSYSFDNGLIFQSENKKSGLEAGFYNVIIKNSAGCVSPTVICELIDAGPASEWDGANWLNGDPDSSRAAVFASDFNSVDDIEACSCRLINNAEVHINSEHTLKVDHSVSVLSGALVFENNASLLQINDTEANSGNIKYKRYTAPVRRYDFTYWSSPVAGQIMNDLSPNTLYDKYYSYDNGWKISYQGLTTMEAGKGYSIRAPQTFSITDAEIDYDCAFEGIPNNGTVTLILPANQACLLGNPYPSAIDANAFLDTNTAVLEGTLYFWTHNTPPKNTISGDEIYNYTSDDYATYNRTGGVSTSISAVSGESAPSGKIAAGQGFFALASATGGSLIFNNTMRVSGGLSEMNNSQFFKKNPSSKGNTTAAAEKNRIWLNLTNKQGAFKQTLIGYLVGATNDFDNGFDGKTFDGNQFVDFYSINKGMNLVIQGRSLPFVEQDSVILGYKSAIKGDFQISIDHTDGMLDNQQVFLEDKVLCLQHDLKKEPYTFTTEKGTFEDRFVLYYVPKNEFGEKIIKTLTDKAVLVSVFDHKIKLSSSKVFISKVSLYDVSKKLLYQKADIAANDFITQHLALAHQVLFVNVVLANKKSFVTKIVY